MGLFGSKKEGTGKGVKITTFFSEEDLNMIKATLEPKLKAGEYGSVAQLTAKGMMDYVNRPDKEFSPSKINGLMKIAETLKQVEPSLEPILQKGIDKYRSIGG